ncbi:MAG: GNAT family N-acetyltransferase [Caldilineaceae bacterium]|nr:GNAT family N-acetyltransferase [Caldilineaceae bacterium]
MHIQSLGYRTDLIFSRFSGSVTDKGDYLVIRTPSNPTYYWGNYLLFRRPPGPDDYSRWRARFVEEIGPTPPVGHMVFGIDDPSGDPGVVQPFMDAGFEVEHTVILTAREVEKPARCNDEVVVRALRSEAEWEANLALTIASFQDDHEPEGYRIFATRLQHDKRAMIDAGLGQRFGAFLGDTLTASLGLFVEDGVGRFQSVGTHPAYRRRGICGRLVYEAARHGLGEMGADVLVMAADPDYHAAQIYESVGFTPTERQVGLQWAEIK